MKLFLLTVALLPALALADASSPPYGHHAPAHHPQRYCRDTNSSIYAEVCVPGFASADKPVELAVKEVADDQYCYTQTRTECEEVTTNVDREICTYSYRSKKETLEAETTQVTYEQKSETMKVTSCAPSGYGKPHGYGQYAQTHAHDSGEHQICREEYQTQQYQIPLVNAPLTVGVEVAVPEPVQNCVTKTIELNEIVCSDVEKQVCIDLAKFVDATATVVQTEAILGEPDCDQVTLTLPTQACSKHGYGH